MAANIVDYNDQGLESDQLYYYRIKAILPDNIETAYSSELRVKTAKTFFQNGELLHDPRYNGNISVIKWKKYDSENEKIYTYHYDKLNRIKAAHYAEGATVGGIWTSEASSLGSFSVNDINYDHNGNILSLTRQSMESSVQVMDALSYAYQGNQLISVLDQAGSNGFGDRNLGGDDYAYDANGNLTKDLNQGIALISYNHLNLPDRIDFENGNYIIYVYDASGAKLAEERYDSEDNLVNEKEYMGAFLYENDTLQFIHHDEGRIVVDPVTESYEYEYHLRDHLGNTRLTLSTKPKEHTFTATFETDDPELATEEEAMFSNIAETRSISLAADANDDGGNEVVRLNGGQPMGPGIALPVSPGDLVSMKVDGYYEGGSDYSNQVGLSAFVSAIAGGFGGLNGGTEAQQATYNAFDNAYGEIGMMGTDDVTVPAAYLNYILFDKNMNSYQHGHTQITDQANMDHLRMTIDDIKVAKVGFVYVYLTNESASLNPVYFDDFEVTLKEFGVVQSDDYYPFGLTFNHYQQVSGKENKYLYQGKEKIADTDWYDFHAKGYSPTLGRFMQIDPHYNGPSGYVGMLNNPMGNVDPTGRDPISLGTALVIAVAVHTVAYTTAIALSPGGFQNWDWGDFGRGTFNAIFSAYVTYGVGTMYQGWTAVSKSEKVFHAVSKAATHATVQGSITYMDGGSFGSSFASGFAGGLVGSAGTAMEWGSVGTISAAMLMGGISAELAGGGFWRGAAVGGIVAGANDAAHEVGASLEEKIRQNQEEQKGEKVDFKSSTDQQIIDRLTSAVYDSRAQGKEYFDLRDYFSNVNPKGSGIRGRILTGVIKLQDNEAPITVSIDIAIYNDRFLINNQANQIRDNYVIGNNFKYFVDFRYYHTKQTLAFLISMSATVPNGYDRLSDFMY